MFCTLSKSVKYHEIYHVIDVSVYAPSLKAFSTLRPQQSTLGVGGLEYYLRVWQGKNMNSAWNSSSSNKNKNKNRKKNKKTTAPYIAFYSSSFPFPGWGWGAPFCSEPTPFSTKWLRHSLHPTKWSVYNPWLYKMVVPVTCFDPQIF